MFGFGDFSDKSPTFYAGNFKIFKNARGQFIPNCPPKNVITSTSCSVGEAETADKKLTLDNRSYVIGRDLLHKRFGDNQVLISAHMRKLLSLSQFQIFLVLRPCEHYTIKSKFKSLC